MKNYFLLPLLVCLCFGCSFGGGASQVPVPEERSVPLDMVDAPTLSSAEANTLAEQFISYLDSSVGVLPDSSPYGPLLLRTSEFLQTGEGAKYSVVGLASPLVDALSFPDGSIRIFAGYLELLNENEIRFILANRIGHIENGYALNRLEVAADRAGLGSQFGSLSATQLAKLANAYKNAEYSVSQEQTADLFAVRFLEQKGISSAVGVSALRKLVALGPKAGFNASRGAVLERIARLEKGSMMPQTAEKRRKAEPLRSDKSLEAFTDAQGKVKSATLKVGGVKESVSVDFQHEPVDKELEDSSFVSGWYLQAAAETDELEAVSKVNLLGSVGVRALVQEALVNNIQYYRVLVGPYSTRIEAETQRDQIIRTGVSRGEPFARRIE